MTMRRYRLNRACMLSLIADLEQHRATLGEATPVSPALQQEVDELGREDYLYIVRHFKGNVRPDVEPVEVTIADPKTEEEIFVEKRDRLDNKILFSGLAFLAFVIYICAPDVGNPSSWIPFIAREFGR
ncbi:hypothetical protein EON81_26015 [bacterium]|nr:MAG: hypothetical protein EON81_26015 [bacterium]